MTPGAAWGCRLFAAAVSFLIPLSAVQAAEQVVQSVAISPLAGSLQMLLGLSVVLALIAGTAWLLRRFAPGQVAGHGELRVVAAVAVGPKERVVLVDVGETRLVLGVAPGMVTRLHEMPRPAQPDSQFQPSVAPPMLEKFKEMLAARGGAK